MVRYRSGPGSPFSLNRACLFGHVERRRRYRFSYTFGAKVWYWNSKWSVFLMPRTKCMPTGDSDTPFLSGHWYCLSRCCVRSSSCPRVQQGPVLFHVGVAAAGPGVRLSAPPCAPLFGPGVPAVCQPFPPCFILSVPRRRLDTHIYPIARRSPSEPNTCIFGFLGEKPKPSAYGFFFPRTIMGPWLLAGDDIYVGFGADISYLDQIRVTLCKGYGSPRAGGGRDDPGHHHHTAGPGCVAPRASQDAARPRVHVSRPGVRV